MSKSGKLHFSTGSIMKGVIIWDDFAFGAKASAMLRRVGHRTELNVRWEIKCWPVNALSKKASAETALLESLDAHLVVLPARCAGSLTNGVLDWLGRWAAQRENQDAALGVIRDDNSDCLTQSMNTEPYMFARQHGLHVINGECSILTDEEDLLVHSPGDQAVLLPIDRLNFVELSPRHSYRGFGIND